MFGWLLMHITSWYTGKHFLKQTSLISKWLLHLPHFNIIICIVSCLLDKYDSPPTRMWRNHTRVKGCHTIRNSADKSEGLFFRFWFLLNFIDDYHLQAHQSGCSHQWSWTTSNIRKTNLHSYPHCSSQCGSPSLSPHLWVLSYLPSKQAAMQINLLKQGRCNNSFGNRGDCWFRCEVAWCV